MSHANSRHVDVVIATAIRMEFDAVLQVEAGAVPGSVWETTTGPHGLPVALRSFMMEDQRPLRVAVAQAPSMGATATVNTLLPVMDWLKPRCIAMCGVCAGRKGKVNLGDVVAADRLYYHDAGKQLADQVQQDLTTYNLRVDWKAALDDMRRRAVVQFSREQWFQTRPLTPNWRERCALVALRNRVREPWTTLVPPPRPDDWQRIVAALRERGLLAASGQELTDDGHRFVDDLLFEHMNVLPDLSPSGGLHPFRLHVAPIGSGSRVMEDDQIWSFVSKAMRTTLGIEMEVAAIGELVHSQRSGLDWVVMKGVMDFADHGRDDSFKEFAARASAECLLWFLREHMSVELVPGFDDLLTPGTSSVPTDSLSPSSLLLARHTVVPWHDGGRSSILAELDAWADDRTRDVAVKLVHAAGGVGKTRLAIEWIRRRRERQDVAGFLVMQPDSHWLERLCGLGPPVLVVIDYAERRADLLDVLHRVASFATGRGQRRRVRILLLARSDGHWWTDLRRRHGALGALLHDVVPDKLTPLAVTAADREAVFREAGSAFATLRGVAAMPRPPASLDDARFERVLYLHMAALAAVEGASFNAGSLMDVILDHEEHFWQNEALSRHVMAAFVPLARQIMAAATLRGGFATQGEAREVCARLAERPRTSDDDGMLALLNHVYARSSEPMYLPGLEPDLVGEAMVLRVAQPPLGAGEPAGDSWIDRALERGDDDASITTAFIVLGRASVDAPRAVRPWIRRLLATDLTVRAVLALRAAKTVGQHTAYSELGALLTDALECRGSAVIAVDLDHEGIPYPSVSLNSVARWRNRRLLTVVPHGDDAVVLQERAALLSRQGVDEHAAGQYDAARDATLKAVTIYRALESGSPHEIQPLLAATLNNLGNSLGELGQRQAAREAMSEAVELYRKLDTRNPGTHRHDLARSLNNLGASLHALGEHGRALDTMRDAVKFYRILWGRNPDRYRAPMAMSLNNLGAELSGLERYEEALVATKEAVKLYYPLVRGNPDAFQPEHARSLNNLGIQWSRLGHHRKARNVAQRAVDLYRRLAAQNPDAFDADLAKSLNNLGNRHRDVGHHEAALVVMDEAVSRYRVLAARNPEAFQPDLAKSLNNLSDQLATLKQHDAALGAAKEAVTLCRLLTSRQMELRRPSPRTARAGTVARPSSGLAGNPGRSYEEAGLCRITLTLRQPDAYYIQLARSLTQLGIRSTDTGRSEAALAATREAVTLYRVLVKWNPDAFQSDLAQNLIQLAAQPSISGQEGLAAAQEAVALCRVLAASQPTTFEPQLARSLSQLCKHQNELHQLGAAIETARETADLYRKLASRAPHAFQADLACALRVLGDMASSQGAPDAGLAYMTEAVALCRILEARHPGVFERELAKCLYSLSNWQSRASQPAAARDAAHEAVRLYRGLAAIEPAKFLPELAGSLNLLGIRLRDLQDSNAALPTTLEAIDIYRKLAQHAPQDFRERLAASLNNLGSVFHDLGLQEAALGPTREAVELRRALAARSSWPSPSLAASLSDLGGLLSGLGMFEEAIAVTHEAVEIYRGLSTVNARGFEPLLAKHLCSLGLQMDRLGQGDEAAAAVAEAREIAARNPDAARCLSSNAMAIASLVGPTHHTIPAPAADRHPR